MKWVEKSVMCDRRVPTVVTPDTLAPRKRQKEEPEEAEVEMLRFSLE